MGFWFCAAVAEVKINNVCFPLSMFIDYYSYFAVLMKEARLTMTQRKSLMNNLRSGGSSSTTTSATSIIRSEPTTAIKRHRSFKPRTLKDIVESGAYQRESYVPSSKLSKYIIISFVILTRVRPLKNVVQSFVFIRFTSIRCNLLEKTHAEDVKREIGEVLTPCSDTSLYKFPL